MSSIEFAMRPRTGEESETGFIFSSWMRGAREWGPDKNTPTETYNWYQHKIIESLMEMPGAVWTVATHKDDPTTYFGFCCGQVFASGPVLHWIHVKKNLQRYGIASAMLHKLRDQCVSTTRDAPLTTTATTLHWQRTPLSHYAIYNPWCLYTACLPIGWQRQRQASK